MVRVVRGLFDADRAAELSEAFSGLLTYDDDGRAHGFLYSGPHGRAWPKPYAKAGKAVLADVSAALGVGFETVSFQGYADGRAWCDWHYDACDAQAVLSLGAERAIEFEDRTTGEVSRIKVRNGDVWYQEPGEQDAYRHRVPPTSARKERLALVFRTGSVWG